jgi:hypothetical protein
MQSTAAAAVAGYLQAHCHGDPEQFALVDVTRDDLVPLGRVLDDPDVAGKQKEKLGFFLALRKDLRVLGVSRGAGSGEGLLQFRGRKAPKGRQSGYERFIEIRHSTTPLCATACSFFRSCRQARNRPGRRRTPKDRNLVPVCSSAKKLAVEDLLA